MTDHEYESIPNSMNVKCRVCGQTTTLLKALVTRNSCPGSGKVFLGKAQVFLNGKPIGTVKEISYHGMNAAADPGTLVIKCTCGAASVGAKAFGPGHSDWCDLREARK